MSIINQGDRKMHDLDDYVKNKKAMGQRFKQFRELIGKSKKELADEAEEALIMDERINLFEKGAIRPDIIFIQYFTEEYGLNLTWLVKGTGKPFFKKGRKTRPGIYTLSMEHGMDSPLIQEIIRLNRQSKVQDFPKHIPKNHPEVDGRMMC
jgi:transcriptional regulator with XRE-family HTH domain